MVHSEFIIEEFWFKTVPTIIRNGTLKRKKIASSKLKTIFSWIGRKSETNFIYSMKWSVKKISWLKIQNVKCHPKIRENWKKVTSLKNVLLMRKITFSPPSFLGKTTGEWHIILLLQTHRKNNLLSTYGRSKFWCSTF